MIVIASDRQFIPKAAGKKEVHEFVKRSLYQRTLGS